MALKLYARRWDCAALVHESLLWRLEQTLTCIWCGQKSAKICQDNTSYILISFHLWTFGCRSFLRYSYTMLPLTIIFVASDFRRYHCNWQSSTQSSHNQSCRSDWLRSQTVSCISPVFMVRAAFKGDGFQGIPRASLILGFSTSTRAMAARIVGCFKKIDSLIWSCWCK